MTLSMKEEQRVNVIQGVMDGKMTREEAARLLAVKVRQIYRLLTKVRDRGIRGLMHGNKGRESPRKIPESFWRRVIGIVRKQYLDVNDLHLQELLKREEKIVVGRESLRKRLREAQIGPKQKRRRSKYRKRRERKEACGMMLQLDGSLHDWLEGRGPWLTLVGAIDDATSHVWARFEEAETTWAYFHLMEGVFASHGLPASLYSDRHSIFHILKEPTIIEQLNNQRPLTQFGRAMEALGITILKAWSPQAKGRIERLWRTFQDRLGVELRLAGAKTREEANEVLKRFLPESNHRFAVQAKQAGSLFRKPPSPSRLDRILCLKEDRVVNKDHTVSFEGLALQIPPSSRWASIAGQKVQVLQLKDGAVEIVYKNLTVARFSPQAISRLVNQIKPERSQLRKAA